MTYLVCPCDGEQPAAPVNLPELSHIAYRIGIYVDFRQAVLTPLFVPATPQPLPVEQTLSVNGVPVWRTDGVGDLAVMIAEWFAYIADILTFYNERIANQDYLRTADLPESVNNLIALLGVPTASGDCRIRFSGGFAQPRPQFRRTGHNAAARTPVPEQAYARPGAANIRVVRRHANRHARSAAGHAGSGAARSAEHAPGLAI
jgi:hypothetical protein